MIPKNYKIYIVIFSIIAIGYLVYFTTMSTPFKLTTTEHFTTDEQYESRLHVIKVFDGYLHRNPTMEEIKKYSEFTNEQDILTNVMKDYNTETYTDSPDVVVEEEETKAVISDTLDITLAKTLAVMDISTNIDIPNSLDILEKVPTVENKIDNFVNNVNPISSHVPKMRSIIKELESITEAMEKTM
jgi:hypothetical protein